MEKGRLGSDNPSDEELSREEIRAALARNTELMTAGATSEERMQAVNEVMRLSAELIDLQAKVNRGLVKYAQRHVTPFPEELRDLF